MGRYAVIIGIGEYEDPEITDLDYAALDASEFADCLAQECGFDRVTRLITGGEKEPTSARIVDALTNLAPELSVDDTFLLYFAGQGIKTDNSSYLLTPNSRIQMPELASLPLPTIRRRLRHFDCRDRVLILDACRNDSQGGSGHGTQELTRGFSLDVQKVAAAGPEDVNSATCVLFSCSEGQRAYEWPQKRHGAYTYYLLNGIRREREGPVTVQSVAEYVESQVPRWAEKTGKSHVQRPWSEQVGSLRPVVIAEREPPDDTPKGPGTLEIESQPQGTEITIDGQKKGETPLTVQLDEGKHRVVAAIDGYAFGAETVHVEAGTNESLTFSPGDEIRDVLLEIELEEEPQVTEAFFPMTAEEAREVQRAAVDALGLPVEKELDLGKGVRMKLRLIPAGEFQMGSTNGYSDEKPVHRVRITEPFYMGIYPVTQEQYKVVMGDNPSYRVNKKGMLWWKETWPKKRNPVERVMWNDAREFCQKLSAKTGQNVRLPTEAQWEYACRAETDTAFCFGDSKSKLDEYAWYFSNSWFKTHPVGEKKPNNWGLYDMHGNVWEWCRDWYDSDYYENNTMTDPTGPSGGERRVVRGGSWFNPSKYCRSAHRWDYLPTDTDDYITFANEGFRVVVSPRP